MNNITYYAVFFDTVNGDYWEDVFDANEFTLPALNKTIREQLKQCGGGHADIHYGNDELQIEEFMYDIEV